MASNKPISIRSKVFFKKLRKSISLANNKSLFRAAGYVRKVAQNSIKTRKSDNAEAREKARRQSTLSIAQLAGFQEKLEEGSEDFMRGLARTRQNKKDMFERRDTSKPGEVPLTSRNKQIKNSIKFAVEKTANRKQSHNDVAVVGADAGIMAKIGKRHEQGGKFEGKKYPKRPFMVPAMKKSRFRLPRFWAKSIRT